MSRGRIASAVVALVAILVTGGLAVRAVVGGGTSDSGDLIAAGVDGRDAVGPEGPATTVASIPSAPGTTAPRPTPTAPPPNSVTIGATDPSLAPNTTLGPIVPADVPINLPPLLPPSPSAVQTAPGSWSVSDKGVTITATIEPAEPMVGDTVTITYTTEGEGDFCCVTFVYVDGAVVGQSDLPTGQCPTPPVTSGGTSVEVTQPGPFRFQVQSTRVARLCIPPTVYATATLHVSVPVAPAA